MCGIPNPRREEEIITCEYPQIGVYETEQQTEWDNRKTVDARRSTVIFYSRQVRQLENALKQARLALTISY